MADLPEARDPERKADIDTVGWLFLAFAVVITAAAAMIGPGVLSVGAYTTSLNLGWA
jgi:hypothetical protein